MELSAWGCGELRRGSTCEEQRGKIGHGDWGEDEKLRDNVSASSRGLWSSDCLHWAEMARPEYSSVLLLAGPC